MVFPLLPICLKTGSLYLLNFVEDSKILRQTCTIKLPRMSSFTDMLFILYVATSSVLKEQQIL